MLTVVADCYLVFMRTAQVLGGVSSSELVWVICCSAVGSILNYTKTVRQEPRPYGILSHNN